MLRLVIASSILALSLLAAAIAELFFRWIIEVVGKRAASRPMPSQYEADNRLGLLGEPNQFQAR
ncbi:MAG TPA: hypothetical protein VKP69_13780 [Isosphaeraceae bacterium]|nr:hypothetical protein [Isosphaeraceae bacterium]